MKKLFCLIIFIAMVSFGYAQPYAIQEVRLENNSPVTVKVNFQTYDATNCQPTFILNSQVTLSPNTTIDYDLPELVYSNKISVSTLNNCGGPSNAYVVNNCIGTGQCNYSGSSNGTIFNQPDCSQNAEQLYINWTGCHYSTLEIN